MVYHPSGRDTLFTIWSMDTTMTTRDEIRECLMKFDQRDMVREFNTFYGLVPSEELSLTLIKEEMEELLNATSPENELKEYVDLHYVIYSYKQFHKNLDIEIPEYYLKKYSKEVFEEAFRRVHQNNMERCLFEPYEKLPGDIPRVYKGEVFYVRKRPDGKVLKNPNYPKVDLKDLVDVPQVKELTHV